VAADFSNNQCPIRREIEDLASLAVNTAFSDPDRFIDEYSIAINMLLTEEVHLLLPQLLQLSPQLLLRPIRAPIDSNKVYFGVAAEYRLHLSDFPVHLVKI